MPIIEHRHRSVNGQHMFLGANFRPHDPRSDKYRLSLRLDPSGADLTQERNLGHAWFGATPGADYRGPITDQGQIGACTGFTNKEAAEMLFRLNGEPPVNLSAGWLYEMERRKENGANWQQDIGAYTSDGFDIQIATGCPADALLPYTGRADTEYNSPAAQADAPKQKYVLAYYPINPRDPNVLQLIWKALDAYMPVYVETYWPEGWFNPGTVGVQTMDFSSYAGGHSILCFASIPDTGIPGGGAMWELNHWTPGWNTQAARYGHSIRAGEFGIPWAAFTDPNTPIMGLGAIAKVPIAPQPQPQPTDCRGQAAALADPLVASYLADAKAHPRSLTRKAALAGAQAVQKALTAL